MTQHFTKNTVIILQVLLFMITIVHTSPAAATCIMRAYETTEWEILSESDVVFFHAPIPEDQREEFNLNLRSEANSIALEVQKVIKGDLAPDDQVDILFHAPTVQISAIINRPFKNLRNDRLIAARYNDKKQLETLRSIGSGCYKTAFDYNVFKKYPPNTSWLSQSVLYTKHIILRYYVLEEISLRNIIIFILSILSALFITWRVIKK